VSYPLKYLLVVENARLAVVAVEWGTPVGGGRLVLAVDTRAEGVFGLEKFVGRGKLVIPL
jgi:hypothetical protein